MGKRIIALDVEDEKLTESKASKKTVSKKSVSQKETEKYGIVEINNLQAKSKVKNSSEKGFEKHTLSTTKKGVKSNLQKVDDYFDFSFRPTKAETKQSNNAKAAAVKKETNLEVVKEKTSAQTVAYRAELVEERGTNVTAEASERVIDDDAARIIAVARIGALFDCEICQKFN